MSQSSRKIERHPRLRQLDRELLDPTTTPHAYVTATRGDQRISVCVMREDDNRTFVATAKIAGRVHRVYGAAPSHAVADLIRQMQWAIRWAARRAV